ncbi:uncharacterized protein UV8b_00257 [Ustilaginoidea virens]|uniref:Uncharacterized protein n=2 Tax=Ustilaginoidea virens TaxID=1159556 RepID=A0A8E5HIE9_USTVR|nr:uncharacterized protein UV8b_00257 [Ustilaginoidea virens]QUC16016.1 hypothetical protein UV8b_00257 [Ustilaginoidea virens]
MEQAIDQPDFLEVASGLRVAADHLERCRNLPAEDDGARMAHTLQTMLERIDAMERNMNRRFDQVERRMDGFDRKQDDFDRKLTVSNKNLMARLQNSIVVHDNVALAPLYSVITGEVMERCPSTLADLERMSHQEVADLLRHSDEPVPRTIDQRRRQLRHAFGVRTKAD